MPLANFHRRAVGFGIDFFLVFLARMLIETAWQHYMPHGWEQHTRVDLIHVRSLTVLVFYFALALYFGKGQTVGKWIAGTKVISLTHRRVTLWQAVERALGYGASFLELGFGFMQFFFDRNRQCVHDRIAETIVADVRKQVAAIESKNVLVPSIQEELEYPRPPAASTSDQETQQWGGKPAYDEASWPK